MGGYGLNLGEFFWKWVENKLSRVGGGGGGWLDQVELKLTQSPAEAGVEVGTELGKSV